MVHAIRVVLAHEASIGAAHGVAVRIGGDTEDLEVAVGLARGARVGKVRGVDAQQMRGAIEHLLLLRVEVGVGHGDLEEALHEQQARGVVRLLRHVPAQRVEVHPLLEELLDQLADDLLRLAAVAQAVPEEAADRPHLLALHLAVGAHHGGQDAHQVGHEVDLVLLLAHPRIVGALGLAQLRGRVHVGVPGQMPHEPPQHGTQRPRQEVADSGPDELAL